jgi:VWFA-related protein
MKPSRHLIIAGLLLLGIGGAAAPSGAQNKVPKAPPFTGQNEDADFGETVNVTVVNVDVYVTDKQGKRVTGLTKDDFQIFENKRPVEITNFYAVQDGQSVAPPVEAPQEAEAPAAPAPGVAVVQKPRTPEDQRLRLIVYIDNFNLRPFNRNRVMRELRAFIGTKLTRDDQIMLVTYDRELHVRRALTSDPSLVASAMLELEKISAQAVHQDSERRDVLERIEDSRSVSEAEMAARSYAESTYNDLSFSINALKEIVNSLAGVPGRKAILYVSDGLQMIAGQDVFYAIQNKYGEQSTSLTQQYQYDTSRRFTELTAQANANRITFYTIDAAGLRAYDSNSAQNRGPGSSAPGLSTLIDSVNISNLQAPLQKLAEDTGGVAILNANQITPQLDRIAGDFGTFYSLGYTPHHYGDGRYYKVEVKLKKKEKGYVVRHREGYRDKSTDSRMTDGTVAALSFPYEENPLGISMTFGKPTARPDGFYVVPVEVKIPIGKLVLMPRGETHDANVRLFVAAIDSTGNTSDVQQTPVPITVPAADLAAASGKHYVYTVSLLMRAGDQRVAIGVRDDIAGEASFISGGLRVGGAAR